MSSTRAVEVSIQAVSPLLGVAASAAQPRAGARSATAASGRARRRDLGGPIGIFSPLQQPLTGTTMPAAFARGDR